MTGVDECEERREEERLSIQPSGTSRGQRPCDILA
jgi:hypothetical protein